MYILPLLSPWRSTSIATDAIACVNGLYHVISFCRAEAIQSVIQLLGEKELYDYYSDQYKVHSINWSQEKAKKILEAWQRKFTQVHENLMPLINALIIHGSVMASHF